MFNFADGGSIVWVFTVLSAYLTCILVVFVVIGDLINDHALAPSWKGAWIAFLIFVPFLTLFVYLLVRGRDIYGRRQHHAELVSQASDTYLRNLGLQHTPADEIAKARLLCDEGILTEEQYERIKAIALAS